MDEAIAKANALNKDAYTNFTAVESAINAVVRDKNITEQDEVDAMAQAIEKCHHRVGGKAHRGSDCDADGNTHGCAFCEPDGGSDRDAYGDTHGCAFCKPNGGSDRDAYGKTDGYAFCEPDGGSDRDAYGKTDGYADSGAEGRSQ